MNPDVQNYLEHYQTTQAYLRLCTSYCNYLGGIRWSGDDDVLVYPDGNVFAFHAPIAEFLEGFSGGGRVIPFACVLHWAHLLQHGKRHPVTEVRRLHECFAATGSLWRNAGALAAVLSAKVPEAVQPPRLEHVCRRLRDRAFPIRWFTARFHESSSDPAEMPALEPREFERHVVERLAAYSDDDLRSWLSVGRGPLCEAGRTLAKEQPPPRTLTGVLAALLQRPRLAGAEIHVTRLVGALTLPPRRLTRQELPVGGYADMTTHGQVEHILPSQHALDELEFIRRYAERELLFFRREEPPAQNRQEIVVLIDQGVRTWGDVRLVLAAAALALGKQSAARQMRFTLAATSNGGIMLDPLEADEESLAELMEGSDLSLNPSRALEAVLEQPAEALRDVVLLTHPRNLQEPDVRDAACRAGPRDRLFAVTLDEEGAAMISELRRGSAVKLRQFHVDYTPAPAPLPPMPELVMPAEPLPPWTGDVEPVPFPFRFGTSGAVAKFEFDHDGRWLLTIDSDGLLHLWGLNGKHREVLPRPFQSGMLLGNVQSITGVKDGFVVVGRAQDRIYAAYFDVVRRNCRAQILGQGPVRKLLDPQYVSEFHTILLLISNQPGSGPNGYRVDLTTGAVHSGANSISDPRIRLAWATLNRLPTRVTEMAMSEHTEIAVSETPTATCHYRLNEKTGTITVTRGTDNLTFTPTADGKPLLLHATIWDAQAVRDLLALRGQLGDGSCRLMLFKPSEAAVLREHRVKRKQGRFLLSHDGQWLALERPPRILVEKIVSPSEGVVTRCGGYSGEGRLYLGDQAFMIVLGQGATHRHLVRWAGAGVEFFYDHKKPGPEGFHTLGFEEVRRGVTPATAQLALNMGHSALYYDPNRFVLAGRRDSMVFAMDRFGQLAVFGKSGALLCMFMAFRDRLAAWLPDGSRCGSESLSLGPETPGAREQLAAVLKGSGSSLSFPMPSNDSTAEFELTL